MSSPPAATEPRFPFLLVDVEEADADEASALLFELGAGGVEERDATTLVKGTPGKRTLVAYYVGENPVATLAL